MCTDYRPMCLDYFAIVVVVIIIIIHLLYFTLFTFERIPSCFTSRVYSRYVTEGYYSLNTLFLSCGKNAEHIVWFNPL